jgi:hypothetical protein
LGDKIVNRQHTLGFQRTRAFACSSKVGTQRAIYFCSQDPTEVRTSEDAMDMACHLLLRFELPLVCSDGPGSAPTRRAEHTESRAEHCVWRITGFLRMVGPNGLEPSTSSVSRKRSNQTELRAYMRMAAVSILPGVGWLGQCFALDPSSRNRGLITG